MQHQLLAILKTFWLSTEKLSNGPKITEVRTPPQQPSSEHCFRKKVGRMMFMPVRPFYFLKKSFALTAPCKGKALSPWLPPLPPASNSCISSIGNLVHRWWNPRSFSFIDPCCCQHWWGRRELSIECLSFSTPTLIRWRTTKHQQTHPDVKDEAKRYNSKTSWISPLLKMGWK